MSTPPARLETPAHRRMEACVHEPVEGSSTGFLPIGIALVLLLSGWMAGLFQ